MDYERECSTKLGLFHERYALEFDSGGTDYVNVGHASSLNPTNAISVEAKIIPYTITGQHGIIGDKENFGNHFYLYLRDEFEKQIAFGINGLDFVRAGSLIAGPTLYHIIGTYSKSSGKITVYVNGQPVGQEATSASVSTSTKDLLIGKVGLIDSPQGFHGIIDEVRVYSRELTSAEADERFHGQYKNEANLVGFWRFEEGSGLTTADSSGNGNTGTISGATWYSLPFERWREVGRVRIKSSSISLLSAITTDPAKILISALIGLATSATTLLSRGRQLRTAVGLSSIFNQFGALVQTLSTTIGLITTSISTQKGLTRTLRAGVAFAKMLWIDYVDEIYERTLHVLTGLGSTLSREKTTQRTLETTLGLYARKTPGLFFRAGIGLTSSVIRGVGQGVSATLGLLASTVSWSRSVFRGLTATIGLTGLLKRTRRATELLSAIIGLISSFNQGSFNQTFSAQIGVLPSKIAKGVARGFSNSLGLISTFSRAGVSYSRGITLVIVGLVSTTSNERVFNRLIEAQEGLLSTTSRTLSIFRDLSTSIGLSSAITRLTTSIRDLSSSLGLTSTINRSTAVAEKLFSTVIGLTSSITGLQLTWKILSATIGLITTLSSTRTWIRGFSTTISLITSITNWSRAIGRKTLKFFRYGWQYYG